MESPVLTKLFTHIDTNKEKYIDRLREVVAIPSISAFPDSRNQLVRVVQWTEKRLKNLGAEVKLCDVGMQELPGGPKIPLPPVVFGTLGSDPQKKTVCIYGHLDVQPALKQDGWDTEPFELVECDGKLFGRGTSDDKGPVLCSINAVEAYQEVGIPLPVNIKFVFEAMEESGSLGLDDLLYASKDGFLRDIDYVCVNDNFWLGTNTPCITYGLRGLCYFLINIECAKKDLHSGVFGGTVQEAMPDLIYLLNTLVDKNGNILIPDLYKEVAPLMSSEKDRYKDIDFDVEEYRKDIGATKLLHKDKIQVLMHRWRYPSLSIHGIEGAFSEPGQKTVVPSKVTGKFSIRLVPNQEPDTIKKYVLCYLEQKWRERSSHNQMKVYMTVGGRPWMEDTNDFNYRAGRRATKLVYGVEPDLTREGGAVPATLTLKEVTGKSVMLLPIGAGDDGAHCQNEKLDVRNYIGGIKLLAAYLHELAQGSSE